MTLADRLNNRRERRRPGSPCSVAVLLDTLEGSERDALVQMLEDRDWTQDEIHATVTAEGHTVAVQTINRHRRGACRCFR